MQYTVKAHYQALAIPETYVIIRTPDYRTAYEWAYGQAEAMAYPYGRATLDSARWQTSLDSFAIYESRHAGNQVIGQVVIECDDMAAHWEQRALELAS